MLKVFVFGDSLAFGRCVTKNQSWVSRLVFDLDQEDKDSNLAYNLSIPGETSLGLLKRIELENNARFWPSFDPSKAITIFALGLNDAKIVKPAAQPQVSPQEFKDNILALINLAKKYTERLIFVGLTPVDEEKALQYAGRSFLNANIENYDHILKTVCRKKDIVFVEIFADWSENQKNKNFLSEDGIHPNKLGHQDIYTKVKPFVFT